MLNRMLVVLLMAIASVTDTTSVAAAGLDQHSYPRIMGMNISRPSYYDTPEYQEQLSKPAIVILGFYEGWGKGKKRTSERDVVLDLKRKNSTLLIGQYTVLNEWKATNDPLNVRQELSKKLDAEDWWLRDSRRKQKRWTSQYRSWDINITEWSKPDQNGNRYPEWLAKKDYETFFQPVPEFDIWYFDNVFPRPYVKRADWDNDGHDDSRDDPRIASAHRNGEVAHWEEARRLHPTALFIGNSQDVSSPEYSGKLQGVFMEGVIGKSWSIERWEGWDNMMDRYRMTIKHTAPPHIVGFNVHGKKDDYQRMRYGLTSCLMDDGYFSYTDEATEYGSVPWFDEYDSDLGMPVDPPSSSPWKNGVYRRTYQKGIVLVNPSRQSKTVTVEMGYRRIKGTQAPEINDGSDATSITLGGKDGIILVKK